MQYIFVFYNKRADVATNLNINEFLNISSTNQRTKECFHVGKNKRNKRNDVSKIYIMYFFLNFNLFFFQFWVAFIIFSFQSYFEVIILYAYEYL